MMLAPAARPPRLALDVGAGRRVCCLWWCAAKRQRRRAWRGVRRRPSRRPSRRGAVRRGPSRRRPARAALGGLWRGEYQLDDPSLLLLRGVVPDWRRRRRCRRSGRCPARRPAATASRWSRPPTRAACTSGRRRGEPLLCWGLPLFCCPISSTGRGLRAISALGQLALSKLRQRRMAHIRVLSSVFYWQSASVTSQPAEVVRVVHCWRALCFCSARVMVCSGEGWRAKT